jgi:exodeoxyribonuclease V alpha subunit
VTVTGTFAQVSAGELFECHGSWVSHKDFGRQFKSVHASPVKPETRRSLIKFLHLAIFKDIRGLGEKAAERVVKHFGLSTFEVMDETPERLTEVKGLASKYIDPITDAWDDHRNNADAIMFMTSHGLSMGVAQKIVKRYSNQTIKIINEDPYRLAMEVRGVGFKTADVMASSLGIPKDSLQRIKAGLIHVLKQAEDNGHCYLPNDQLCKELNDLLEVSLDTLLEKLPEGLQELNDNGIVVSISQEDEEKETVSLHFSADLYEAEQTVSERISDLVNSPFTGKSPSDKGIQTRMDIWIEKYSTQTGTTLSEDQLLGVKEAAESKVFVLTGGPGVGKTTTSNTIIRLLMAMGKDVALAAPTGRAAQRMTEVSGIEAKTIHRLLEWNPNENTFLRNEYNTIKKDVIIVDETSMLDIRLAAALFSAVSPTSQIILIGDVDQLPSVGPGSVLRDFIESGVIPFRKLDKVFRQAATSKIISAAHRINQGQSPDFDNSIESDCRFIDCDSPKEIKSIINDLISTKLPEAGWDPTKDIQILTPMNRGDLGNEIINEEVQELLNPHTSKSEEYKRKNSVIRNGDKVIQVVNDYELAVFNGDIGFVNQTNTSKAKVIVSYGDRNVSYDSEQAFDLKLAYSITIHKSQGSEFPVVIIPCSMSHYVMLQRNLFYTGLTRAKKLAIFVGSKKALQQASRNLASLQRLTNLKYLLAKNCKS